MILLLSSTFIGKQCIADYVHFTGFHSGMSRRTVATAAGEGGRVAKNTDNNVSSDMGVGEVGCIEKEERIKNYCCPIKVDLRNDIWLGC